MTVGPMTRNGECKKFSPNIFNKSKCTNCFRQKEEHSAEALESNRVSKTATCEIRLRLHARELERLEEVAFETNNLENRINDTE